MRPALLLVLLAACTTTVRDYPVVEPGTATALLAGGLDFEGSMIAPVLRLRAEGGRHYIVRPEYNAFLVAVPPGVYEIERFGNYSVKDDRLTVVATQGVASYIGTFQAVRDDNGEMRILVIDDREEVTRVLAERYGERETTPALVRSALSPMPGGREDLVIAVERVRSPGYPYWSFGAGIYYGHYGDHYYYRSHYHRHHRRTSRSGRGYHRR